MDHHPGETPPGEASVHVSLRKLAQSIGTLADPGLDDHLEAALHRAVDAARDLLDADSAGLMLADPEGQLRRATAVDGRARLAEWAQERLALGPCVEAFEEGRPVAVWDLGADDRWAPVREQLRAARIGASLSVPVMLGGGPVGVLDLYAEAPRLWDDTQMAAAQAYAGVLSLLLAAILSATAASELADQLQHALTARVRVEQAKGALMARDGLGEREAWERLRHTARSTRRPVSAVAQEVLDQLDRTAGGSARPDQAD
jgi:GAF domain-containing protein